MTHARGAHLVGSLAAPTAADAFSPEGCSGAPGGH
jgi:hypothetical protein